MKNILISMVVLCTGVVVGILTSQYKNIYLPNGEAMEMDSPRHLAFVDINVSSSVMGENSAWIRTTPNNDSFISYFFDFDAKEIGIINFVLNDKLPETEAYTTPVFDEMFKQLVLSEQEQLWYPNISSQYIFYQPIKEADFDTFVILPGGIYAMDKNYVYSLSDIVSGESRFHDRS
jgi:hypothetical protein